MARRPSLISPGSIIPQAAAAAVTETEPGLLEKIVQKDGNRHGRTEAAPQTAPLPDDNRITGNTVSNITGNTVSQSAGKPVSQLTDRLVGQPADTPTGRPVHQPADKLISQPLSQPADPRTMIRGLGTSAAVAITLKAPAELNAYLDDYVHERHREKIRKQDLIKRGLMLAIYELETGEELVRFDG